MDRVPRSEAAADSPLAGRSVIVTRAEDQAAGLAEPLAALGAEVLLMPVIRIADPADWGPTDEAIARIGEYDFIVVTSTNGIDRLDERLRARGTTLADAVGRRLAVVGEATAARARALGVEPALVPQRQRAEGLVDLHRDIGIDGKRVLIARAEEAREILPDELRALGATVDVVPLYRLETARPPQGVIDRLAAGTVDVVTFASGGTARRFLEAVSEAGLDADEVMCSLIVASIGPVTTEALERLGYRADIEAEQAGAASLVDALVAHYTEP